MATYFHIGLPKTATTFWQYAVFKKVTDLSLVHRSRGEKDLQFLRRLLSYTHAGGPRDAADGHAIADYLRRRGRKRDAIVSNENVSLTSKGFWRGNCAAPERVADDILALGRAVGADRIGVVIGLRRPDDWIASRYAESSKSLPGFDQADFAARIARLVNKKRLEGPERWLDQAYVTGLFRDVFGAQNVHFPRMEALGAAPRETILAMGRFLGGRDFAPIVETLAASTELQSRPNRLGTAHGTWRLRSTGDTLHFPADLRAAFLDRFAADPVL